MKSLTFAAALFVTLGSASMLFAGAPYQALDAGDVFVATITRVEDKNSTNARPPRVWLEVHEVLRGQAQTIRSPALWSPPFHGIDWGDGNQPELKRWYAAPLKGPQVGQKFILGGASLKPAAGVDEDEKNAPVYNLFDFVRFPYSDEARAKTIATLAALDAERRRYAAELAAAARDRAQRGQKWRAAMTDRVIDKRTGEADIVAIGQVTSGAGYEFETVLKGLPRVPTGVKYFVTLPSDGYDPRIADLVSERPRCILFLSDKDLIASVAVIQAQLIDPYEGIVVADAAAVAAVKASLAKRPAPKQKPVLVISALDRADAAPLAAAARANFVVVNSHQFSGHGPNSIAHVRNTIPHVGFLVMIDRGPNPRVTAVQIHPASATTLYEAAWPKNDAANEIAAWMKVLINTVNTPKR
jgi:hypothetical protein